VNEVPISLRSKYADHHIALVASTKTKTIESEELSARRLGSVTGIHYEKQKNYHIQTKPLNFVQIKSNRRVSPSPDSREKWIAANRLNILRKRDSQNPQRREQDISCHIDIKQKVDEVKHIEESNGYINSARGSEAKYIIEQ